MRYNIRIIAVGSVKEDYYRAKLSFYMSNICKYSNAEIIEINDESIPQNASCTVNEEIKNKEAGRILEHISLKDYVVALCIEGTEADGEGLKKLISEAAEKCEGRITFIIGGSLGLGRDVLNRADYKLSFSKLTFPHRLMRVMLLEQIARVFAKKNKRRRSTTGIPFIFKERI